MKVYRFKYIGLKVWFWGLLQGFGNILDGLIMVCSFGLLASGFGIFCARYRAKAHIECLKNNRKTN